MADIVLINPRFEISYWGMEYALPLIGKRANLPVACLPLLAALTPEEHCITLIDENVEPIDWDRCARADIVGLTGMNVQRARMKEILVELKARGCFTVVGGAMVTACEDYFEDTVDAIFVGEAEHTWPQFLREWSEGLHQRRYEQAERTDMTQVPVPRFDLLKMKEYAFGSLQFSRGCPFECEFCDIIVTFGRRPRVKTAPQVIAELEAMRRARMRIAFVVDDNLIGNKKAIKSLLREVITWQQANGFPLTLFTEASLDLADDPELMELMTEANFVAVFIGIETPNEASFRETRKHQNLRGSGTMLEKVHRVQAHGLEVWCGMIMGFDNDDETIFDRQIEFVQESRIAFAMCGMLSAVPKTPLHARLALEGRLDPSDRPEWGTNVIPKGMSREALRAGYIRVMADLYSPENYFRRLEALMIEGKLRPARPRIRYWKKHPAERLKIETLLRFQAIGFFLRLMHAVRDRSLRAEYRRRLWRYVRTCREPNMVLSYLFRIAMHYHAYTLSRQMTSGRVINTY